jgi:hypothetical protein
MVTGTSSKYCSIGLISNLECYSGKGTYPRKLEVFQEPNEFLGEKVRRKGDRVVHLLTQECADRSGGLGIRIANFRSILPFRRRVTIIR